LSAKNCQRNPICKNLPIIKIFDVKKFRHKKSLSQNQFLKKIVTKPFLHQKTLSQNLFLHYKISLSQNFFNTRKSSCHKSIFDTKKSQFYFKKYTHNMLPTNPVHSLQFFIQFSNLIPHSFRPIAERRFFPLQTACFVLQKNNILTVLIVKDSTKLNGEGANVVILRTFLLLV
jgi:hypothetical protein